MALPLLSASGAAMMGMLFMGSAGACSLSRVGVWCGISLFSGLRKMPAA